MSTEKSRSADARISVDAFWELLAQSGLLNADRMDKVRAAYEKVPRDGGVEDARPLAKWLIAQGLLTRYQAKALLANQPGPFRFGEYTILEPIEEGPLKGHFRGRSAANETVSLRYVTGQRLKRPETLAKLQAELAQWQSIAAPSLIIPTAFVDHGPYKFFVAPEATGDTLAERLRALKVLPIDRACQIIVALARQLAEAHRNNLAHGAIQANRMYWDAEHGPRLLGYALASDPLAGGATPSEDIAQLSALLFLLITGTQLADTSPRADQINPAVPSELSEWLDGVRTRERLPTAEELAAQLAVWTGEDAAPAFPSVERTPSREPADAIRIAVGDAPRLMTPTKTRQKPSPAPLAIGVLLLGIMAGAGVAWQSGYFDMNTPAAPNAPIAAGDSHRTAQSSAADDPLSASDDAAKGYGEPLWERPFAQKPWKLEFVPSGVEMIVRWRPQALLNSVDGSQLALLPGPAGTWLNETLPGMLALPLKDLEEVTLIFLGEENGAVPIIALMYPREPITTAQFDALHNTAPTDDQHGMRARTMGDRVFVLNTKNDAKWAVLSVPSGNIAVLKELREPGALSPQLEKLLPYTAEDADFSVLAAPSFLFETLPQHGDAKPEFWRLLEDWLDRDARAMLLSANFSGDPFLELRVSGDPRRKPRDLAAMWEEQLQAAPDQVRGFIGARTLIPYDQEVLAQFQQMVLVWATYTRLGEENGQFLVRSVLPEGALHNLYLAIYLAQRDTTAAAVAGASTPPAAGPPKSLAEKLQQPVTLAFPNNSLETSLNLLGDEAGFSVVIEGNDLKIEGITKNQAIRDLDEKQRPAGEIVRKILKKADAAGRLVYLMRRNSGTEEEVLVVTTRAAAAQRGDKLPPELEQP